jgi:exopolysaccharide biosynthesis polyprenyl glycosylphosphotransferase
VTVAFGPRLEISERKLLLQAGDALLVIASRLGSLMGWARLARRTFDADLIQSQLYWVLPILLGWLLWMALSDTYNLRQAVRYGSIVWRILAGALAIGLIYLLIFFVTSRAAVTELLPRAITAASAAGPPPLRFAPVVAIAGSTVLLLTWRLIYVLVLCGPQTRPRMLILGAGLAGRALYATIAQHYTANYNVVGFIDDDPGKQSQMIGWVPVLGGHGDLERLAYEHGVDEIALAISRALSPDLMQILMTCHERGLTVTPMPLIYERLTGKVAVEHIGSQWYVALPLQKKATATGLRILKRGLDLAGGLLLGAILLILTPLIALAIKLDSPGPVFYPQQRLGRHGQVFTVFKFRSMRNDAERDGEPQWATSSDPRITRVGHFLRRTRIDELPQTLNVIRGEMSLVGPRPERPEFVESLQRRIPFYRTRLAAKPGLSGWAQINFGYGSSLADSLTKLQYDLYYLKHQSPWFDLLILARTIMVVFRMQGR